MTTINEISNHIMGYFDGTLDAFGYTAQSVNEISNSGNLSKTMNKMRT